MSTRASKEKGEICETHRPFEDEAVGQRDDRVVPKKTNFAEGPFSTPSDPSRRGEQSRGVLRVTGFEGGPEMHEANFGWGAYPQSRVSRLARERGNLVWRRTQNHRRTRRRGEGEARVSGRLKRRGPGERRGAPAVDCTSSCSFGAKRCCSCAVVLCTCAKHCARVHGLSIHSFILFLCIIDIVLKFAIFPIQAHAPTAAAVPYVRFPSVPLNHSAALGAVQA